MNILVTGLSGDIGNAVGRILSESNICSTLLGCDVHEEHGGRQVFDDCFVVPKAEDPNYIPSLRKLVDQNTIGVIIPSSEPEQRFLLSQNMLQKIGRFTQTKGQAQQAWAMAQALRYDKFLPKPDAMTAFALDTKPKTIPADRPTEFMANKGSPYYPRYGSSRGKVFTKMRGAVKTNKAFEGFVNALISLGSSTKDKVKIKRTITQSMKL